MMVTTAAIRRAKLQSNRHHQQTNTQFLEAGCPSCPAANRVKALKGNQNTIGYWMQIVVSESVL